MNAKQLIIVFGLALLLVPWIFTAPSGMPVAAWRASGLALTMALWWLTEAIPLPVTALVPLAFAPFISSTTFVDVVSSYVDPIIILFLGGFLIAKSIEKSDLHRRLAETLVHFAGTTPHRILAAIMLTTAFLSLWISNTASAMVIAPIAAAIAGSHQGQDGFRTALMLGVAFSATIGGMGSLIGTPPNALFAAYVGATYGVTVGFAQWAAVGVPVAILLLLVSWGLLSWVTPGISPNAIVLHFGGNKRPVQRAEIRVGLVAALTATAWIARPLVEWIVPWMPISDAGIAMFAVTALFLFSDGGNGRLLDFKTAATLRWDVLVLFGGGLALAKTVETSGLAGVIGGSVLLLPNLSEFALLIIFATLIIYIGELASNTAMAAIFFPIAGAVAVGINTDPVLFLVPIALAASIGFMLPVATPPNAIVFANPAVRRMDMLRAGAPLDLVALIVTLGTSTILAPIFFP